MGAWRTLGVIVAGAGVWLGIYSGLSYFTLTKTASARWCGNCMLAAFGVPIELGMLGVLLALTSLLRIPGRWEDVLYWSGAAIGVFLTPAVAGVPVFAVCWLILAFSFASRLVSRASGQPRPFT